MASITVAIHGAAGKMGQEVIAALCKEPGLVPVGAVDKFGVGDKLDLPDGSGSIPFSADLDEILSSTSPQVLVDFTQAEATMAAAPVAARHGTSIVIGTTGITENDLSILEQLSSNWKVGILVAPNFAIGAVLLMNLARKASPFFDYVDIIETHHEAKIDAPSGTALAIAKSIERDEKYKRNHPEKETLAGTRGGEYNSIGIHSIRMAGRIAHHEVIFGTAGQTLSIRHDTIGRDCYMPGVLRAIREVVNLKGLVIGLDKILGL